MEHKADINWALSQAEGLWFLTKDEEQTKFIGIIAKYLRKNRKAALTRAIARMKIAIQRELEKANLTEDQKNILMGALEKIE